MAKQPEKKVVAVACRAEPKGSCEGKTAEMYIIRKGSGMGAFAGGGNLVRYTCTDCKRAWTVQS